LSEVKNILDEILDIIEVHTELIDKLQCQAIMHSLQIQELKGKLKIPNGLWILYADAMLEKDKQFRIKFRQKVRELLKGGDPF